MSLLLCWDSLKRVCVIHNVLCVRIQFLSKILVRRSYLIDEWLFIILWRSKMNRLIIIKIDMILLGRYYNFFEFFIILIAAHYFIDILYFTIAFSLSQPSSMNYQVLIILIPRNMRFTNRTKAAIYLSSGNRSDLRNFGIRWTANWSSKSISLSRTCWLNPFSCIYFEIILFRGWDAVEDGLIQWEPERFLAD